MKQLDRISPLLIVMLVKSFYIALKKFVEEAAKPIELGTVA